MRPDNILLVADSVHDADMLYAMGMFVPDPFIYLRIQGQAYAILSDLELDRARKKARHCRIVSLSQWRRLLVKQGCDQPETWQIITAFLREKGIKKLRVSAKFPFALAQKLERHKIKLKPDAQGLYPQRQFKTTSEIKKISASLIMAEVGLAEAFQALKVAKITPSGKLQYRGAPLTSEKLRSIIEVAILQAGGVANHTIVAGGRQACYPHELGSGILKAGQPIVIDICPRSQKTGYFGDISRTVVKGRASEAVRKLHDTVVRGQNLAFSQMRPGTRGSEIHQSIVTYFEREGYSTGKKHGRMQGFFHATGHGVGLEIHETPHLNPCSQDILSAGHVVTVEPGLYFTSLGGMRLEDMAWITPEGPKNLTRFEKTLEIP
jgi:Xaa-Pro aminopeptidase